MHSCNNYKNLWLKTESCLDDFDDEYRKSCGAGVWKSRYYYDARARACRKFWYDSCNSSVSRKVVFLVLDFGDKVNRFTDDN